METQNYTTQSTGAALVILEEDQCRVCKLDTQPIWKIGRYAPGISAIPDILFASKIVSREHGWIQNIDGLWFFIDNPKNLNGTFHNGIKVPRRKDGIKTPVMLESGDILRIDNENLNHASSQGVLMLFTTAPVSGSWTTYSLNQQTTHIGRDKSCDIVLSLPGVSAKHAKVSNVNGNYYLSDNRSRAGTFLNGRQITSSALLREKDCISICDCNYFFLGNKLLFARDN